MDGDGDLDAVFGNGGEQHTTIFVNDGQGHFSAADTLVGSRKTRAVELADFDGDGDLDLLEVRWDALSLVWSNDGHGNFSLAQTLKGKWGQSAAVADLDGDGDADLITGNLASHTVGARNAVWFNDGSGNFTGSSQGFPSYVTYSIDVGDVDGDGDLDFVEGNGCGARNIVWFNNGSGHFTNRGDGPRGGDPNELYNNAEVIFADVDRDGDLDIFQSRYNDQPNLIWLNDGHGHFSDSGQRLGSSNTWRMAAGDLDGDGWVDLITGNWLQQSRVWLNAAHLDHTATETATIDVLPVNDAPTLTAPGDLVMDEDSSVSISGVSVTDVDAGTDPITVTLAADHGSLHVGGSAGVTVTGNGTQTVTLIGPQAGINASLSHLVYSPAADYYGQDTIRMAADDLGNTGSGGPLQDFRVVGIAIRDVADGASQSNEDGGFTAPTPADEALAAHMPPFYNEGEAKEHVDHWLEEHRLPSWWSTLPAGQQEQAHRTTQEQGLESMIGPADQGSEEQVRAGLHELVDQWHGHRPAEEWLNLQQFLQRQGQWSVGAESKDVRLVFDADEMRLAQWFGSSQGSDLAQGESSDSMDTQAISHEQAGMTFDPGDVHTMDLLALDSASAGTLSSGSAAGPLASGLSGVIDPDDVLAFDLLS